MSTTKYSSPDRVLPDELFMLAVKYAQDITGIYRPVKEHTKYVNSFRACFIHMQDLNMVSKEYQNGKTKKSSNGALGKIKRKSKKTVLST